MTEPVWRQFGKGRVQHIALTMPLGGDYCDSLCHFDGCLWNVQKLTPHPDLPKCKRCLALLEKEKRA